MYFEIFTLEKVAMKKLIETVRVAGEDGRLANVDIYQKMIHIPGLLNGRQPARDIPGRKECYDDSGRDVNFISDDVFQVVVTGEILTRIS
jgi:hypothetical protein